MKEDKTMEVLLATENEAEAKNLFDFTKTLTTDQSEKLEALLEGVKIGLRLAAGKTATA